MSLPDSAAPAILDGGGPPADLREQTFNAGETGPVTAVSTALALIVRVLAIMVDIDPKFLRGDLFATGPGTPAERVYHALVEPWLARHPLGRAAEVRASGGGLHLLFRIDPPVEIQSDHDRGYWEAAVKAVQSTLPSDPNAPGLNALTRPLGSVNSKSGATVARLREGGAVSPAEVRAFVSALVAKPFATVGSILYGEGKVSPCPVCRTEGGSLAVLDRAGRCYHCGPVTVAHLLATVMADTAGEVSHVPA